MAIDRYSRAETAKIWSDENRLDLWKKIECLVAKAQAKFSIIPMKAAQDICRLADYQISRIKEIELITQHEFNAFLKNLSENIGPSAAYLHYGMTSSDVLDTTLSIQLTQAADAILIQLEKLLAVLKRRAIEFKDTVCSGRTHGIHAEPMTFGLKLASHWAAFYRNRQRLIHARKEIAVGAISGTVGTYATIDPRVENYVIKELGLSSETISTQIIPRDRHAIFFCTLAVIASSIENLATEIRHLQRSEVREVEERFDKGQTGSSAMPHKRNPIKCENLTGLSRLIRSGCIAALENVTLWHERDISHSSVERVLCPDVTITLDFALSRLAEVMDGLVVYPDKMLKNIYNSGGIIFSQRILLKLTEKGLDRQKSYHLIQQLSHACWQEGQNFLHLCQQNPEIREILSLEELENLFDVDFYLKQIPFIFQRVFEADINS